jgi:glycosyltransferase involved in cell wall biosynthesis
MADTILFDLTRLFYRLRRPNCSGIDRVLLEHAEYFHASDNVMFCAWSGSELRRVPRWLSNLLLDHLRHSWSHGKRRRRTKALVPLRWLGTRKQAVAGALKKACPPLPLERASGDGWIYLNVSHEHLNRIAQVKALTPLMRIVVMLHDIMPITHPDFHEAELQEEFDRAVKQISATADLVLTNSQATADEIQEYYLDRQMRVPRLKHVPLGGPPRAGVRPSSHPQVPRFVYLGTLSERKNIALLDQLWEVLAQGETPPELHLVGSPARGYEAPVRLVEASQVHWHRAVRDAELRDLLTSATALLAPSRAEGFGLPIVEALAHWVPVIASDLPAHREVGGSVIEYLPVEDVGAWAQVVRSYSHPQSRERSAQMLRMEKTTLPRWPNHCEEVLRNLLNLNGSST